jgi:hypothetical protein
VCGNAIKVKLVIVGSVACGAARLRESKNFQRVLHGLNVATFDTLTITGTMV